ncbi:MAG: hypothetical protein HGGPFJEG_00524 [Ignavibacteria bacterium]|nr:hypothetical protein [Ignavibacteria bacterium]
MKFIIFLSAVLFFCNTAFSQGQPPWKRPLKICQSQDGSNFTDISTFQDSAGVPCVIKLQSGQLISAFQWFRQPVGSPTWDKVAVKFSSNDGLTWTDPVPVVMIGFPSNFQRPFDPALALTDSGKIRMYYSSGLSSFLDTSINTYSAVSDDGINYTFEGNIRFSLPDRPVIDPAIIKFNGMWHLVNPATLGATGAYHNISGNGLDFIRVQDIFSDIQHSWIGNFTIMDSSELRFYGSGTRIWYSYSSNGGMWSGFFNTNIIGGDPAVIRLSSNYFLMIYTGHPYPVSVKETEQSAEDFILYQNYPNPFNPKTIISFHCPKKNYVILKVYDVLGKYVETLVDEEKSKGSYSFEWNGENLPGGIYFYKLESPVYSVVKRMVLIK